MKKRKGIALITVLLISALIFTSIVGIVLKVVPEKAMSNAQSANQRALTAAEACISQIAFDLRNTDLGNNKIYPEDTFHYLTVNDVKNEVKDIAKSPVNSVIIPSKGKVRFTGSPDTYYQAKIKRLKKGYDGTWDPGEESNGDRTIYIGIYALGSVEQNGNVKAQRAVYTEMAVTYHKETIYPTNILPNSPVFNYGIFSGSDITFNGDAQEVDGNIFANGYIDLGNAKKTRVVNGAAYAHESIQGNGTASYGIYSGQDEIVFPKLNIDYYKALASAFKTGQKPYDGSVSGYPNTNNTTVKSIITSYLGISTESTLDQIANFYKDLSNKAGLFATLDPATYQQLKDNAKNIVYYINGDAQINGNVKLQGTIVINGNLIINGGSEVDNDGALAMLVNGNVELANGNATLKGIFYTTGSFFGGGTFDCYGAIVSKSAVNLNGTYTIHYQPVSMSNLSIVGTPGGTTSVKNIITAAEQSPNAWREISIDDFNNATDF